MRMHTNKLLAVQGDNMSKLIITFILSVLSVDALGCSFGGVSLFKPTLERWEEHEGPRQKDKNAEGDYWEKVPTPIVKVINVQRGSESPGSSCGDAGVINLEIFLPKSSTYNIEEFGVFFRVLNGKLPDEIFPDIPLIGEIEKEKMSMTLAWLDGHPKHQFPLNIEVEAFLVTNGLNVGSPTRFIIKSGIGTANKAKH